MKELTEKLRQDHADILQALDSARELKVTTSEGFRMLKKSMARLAAHIKREDREFYPGLRSAIGDNTKLSNMLDLFEEDMLDVSSRIRAFIDKFSQNCFTEDYAREFETLYIDLKNRIAKEENVLFPEIEKLLADL